MPHGRSATTLHGSQSHSYRERTQTGACVKRSNQRFMVDQLQRATCVLLQSDALPPGCGMSAVGNQLERGTPPANSLQLRGADKL
eukprot:365849-Chlamydomonas_euryale.AAC.10